ncbi:hypothetical protein ZWY2020_058435 [Hordeum vulgare]|nr:hypothetical protein ZWY2020_058435 [Hordeum vulgare]
MAAHESSPSVRVSVSTFQNIQEPSQRKKKTRGHTGTTTTAPHIPPPRRLAFAKRKELPCLRLGCPKRNFKEHPRLRLGPPHRRCRLRSDRVTQR